MKYSGTAGADGAKTDALCEEENLMFTKKEGAENVVLWREVIPWARASRWWVVSLVWWIIS